jgi:hypothetical protein
MAAQGDRRNLPLDLSLFILIGEPDLDHIASLYHESIGQSGGGQRLSVFRCKAPCRTLTQQQRYGKGETSFVKWRLVCRRTGRGAERIPAGNFCRGSTRTCLELQRPRQRDIKRLLHSAGHGCVCLGNDLHIRRNLAAQGQRQIRSHHIKAKCRAQQGLQRALLKIFFRNIRIVDRALRSHCFGAQRTRAGPFLAWRLLLFHALLGWQRLCAHLVKSQLRRHITRMFDRDRTVRGNTGI